MNQEVTLFDPSDEVMAAMLEYSSAFDVPYVLMGRDNGKDVTELQHLIRSLTDGLTTRKGTMPTLREYGSSLPDFIDKPINGALSLLMLGGVHEFIDRWEPRLQLIAADLRPDDFVEGVVWLDIQAYYTLEGRVVELNNLRLDFKKTENRNSYED
jgi:phage baseplate assembly protein W